MNSFPGMLETSYEASSRELIFDKFYRCDTTVTSLPFSEPGCFLSSKEWVLALGQAGGALLWELYLPAIRLV